MTEETSAFRLDNYNRDCGYVIRAESRNQSDEIRVRCDEALAAELVGVLNRFNVSLVNFREVSRDWLYQKVVADLERQI